MKVLVKNLSGIDSSFKVSFGEYQVSDSLLNRAEQQKDSMNNKYTLRMEKQSRFTSKGGEALDQERKLQKDSKHYL